MATIHHLNCGSMRTYIPGLRGIIHCLLIKSSDGYVLVDTGFGTQDYRAPRPVMRVFLRMIRSPRDENETALAQIKDRGLAREDIKHIVLTHMHLDHAGGLPDFPDAKVHVFRPEYQAAMNPKGLVEQFYIPKHWAHNPHWVLHEMSDDKWFNFDCIPVIEGLTPKILLVPLTGHTRGHCGVAVETDEGWLLHCGDAASLLFPTADPYHPTDKRLHWSIRWLVGDQVPVLRKFIQEHGDMVKLISSHGSRNQNITIPTPN